jgi:hypothetical protein
VASEDLEPNISRAARAVAQPDFAAKVSTLRARRCRWERPKCLRRRLEPKYANLANLYVLHPLLLDVHLRMSAVGDVGFTFEIASGMAWGEGHGMRFWILDFGSWI